MTENKQELNKSGFKQIALYDLLWPKKRMMGSGLQFYIEKYQIWPQKYRI